MSAVSPPATVSQPAAAAPAPSQHIRRRQRFVGPCDAMPRAATGADATGVATQQRQAPPAQTMRDWLFDLPPSMLADSQAPNLGQPWSGQAYTRGAQLWEDVCWKLGQPDVIAFVQRHGFQPDEAAAVVVFTAECPAVFGRLNRALREGDAGTVAEYAPFLAWLLRAMPKLPAHSGVVYRALDSKDRTAGLAYTMEQAVTWPAFTSTSTSLSNSNLQDFGMDRATQEAGVLFVTQVEAGRLLGELSFFSHEKEVLLPPGWRGVVRCTVRDLYLSEDLGVDVSKHTVLELQQEGLPPQRGLTALPGRARMEARLAANPADVECRGDNAMLLKVQFGAFEAARRQYEEALRHAGGMHNNSSSIHGNYATLLMDLGDDAAASEHFDMALKHNPRNGTARANYAMLLERQTRYGEARKQFELSLEHDPNSSTTVASYASLLESHFADYTAARALYERALTLESNDQDAAIHRGMYAGLLFKHFHDLPAARREFERALRHDPNDIVNRGNYAKVLTELKEPDLATEQYEAVVRLAPSNAENRLNFAQHLLALQGTLDSGDARRQIAAGLQCAAVKSPTHAVLAQLAFYALLGLVLKQARARATS